MSKIETSLLKCYIQLKDCYKKNLRCISCINIILAT
uniref:Uncharacterized protein n=1 Tax=Anguilla anguilla TaxID=7936 RepID=A0A0E9SK36_ANGAN